MITIVMPAYNEAEIIEASVRAWHEQVIAKIPGAVLIVVDDCSKDATGEILENLSRELTGLQVLRPAHNRGHGPALYLGLCHAVQGHGSDDGRDHGADYIFQTDSDQQHDPADFWRLWDKRATSYGPVDFVFGARSNRADGLFREIVSKCLALINLALWGRWVADANCPFKLMRREPLGKILATLPHDLFLPMVMISILARKLGYGVVNVPVSHHQRPGGEQSLAGFFKWLRVFSKCLAQLFLLRLTWRRPV